MSPEGSPRLTVRTSFRDALQEEFGIEQGRVDSPTSTHSLRWGGVSWKEVPALTIENRPRPFKQQMQRDAEKKRRASLSSQQGDGQSRRNSLTARGAAGRRASLKRDAIASSLADRFAGISVGSGGDRHLAALNIAGVDGQVDALDGLLVHLGHPHHPFNVATAAKSGLIAPAAMRHRRASLPAQAPSRQLNKFAALHSPKVALGVLPSWARTGRRASI